VRGDHPARGRGGLLGPEPCGSCQRHAAFYEARIETQGDPRGCCVKVFPKGWKHEEGIGVPAQGYRASQIDRMDRYGV
jgi:hypothetical protein